MNDADRTFIKYLIQSNEQVASAAAKCVRDGDDLNLRKIAQDEVDENKVETPILQRSLTAGAVSDADAAKIVSD